ncbi:hypothetical protein QPM17_22785 [Marinobacter sp. TBZ242]|uniref:Uncharacterized protein n=1 Tax=Marinobacter azerbaijanicus TaxID=3050455 RepID=A0ABT7IIJ4_9GAMM|nr:hypothetical protein [Marinobacter sp. TBZ242]MDL0433971.1 hypothetical protein [Marinobacter sp. TBZ242]
MANPDIGTIACPIEKGCVGKVRQYSKGSRKYYYACKHGMITPNLEAGQAWVAANMKPLDPEEQPKPEAKPEPEKTPKPKAKNWLSSLLEDDDE